MTADPDPRATPFPAAPNPHVLGGRRDDDGFDLRWWRLLGCDYRDFRLPRLGRRRRRLLINHGPAFLIIAAGCEHQAGCHE